MTGVSGAIGIAGSAGLMLHGCRAALTGKMPGWDPPRLVPWSAALAMGTLVLCRDRRGAVSGEQGGASGPGGGVAERLKKLLASSY